MNRIMLRPVVTFSLALVFVLLQVIETNGYTLLTSKWFESSTTVSFALGSASGLIDGAASWNAVGQASLSEWNQRIQRFQLRNRIVATASRLPTRNNVNAAVWAGNMPTGVLGIAWTWSRSGRTDEVDVQFSTRFSWNSYRGNLRPGVQDLRRVAVHEFGHMLGLGHPDQVGQTRVAIMNAYLSNLDRAQADDIAGARRLYGTR